MTKPWWDRKPTDPKPIFEPEEDTFNDFPVLKIPIDEDGEPMTFGIKKAKMKILLWCMLALLVLYMWEKWVRK